MSLVKITPSKKPYVYLDYAASTPIDPRVLKSMIPVMRYYYGNSLSLHQKGMEAKELLESIREGFAKILKVAPQEIIFTSSATESNNLAIKGIVMADMKNNIDKNVVTSSQEHSSINSLCNWLEKHGLKVSKVSSTNEGLIDINHLKQLINDNTILVSLIYVNNETGVIQPLEKIGELIQKIRQDRLEREITTPIYFHIDATQAFGKIAIDITKLNCDLLTASAHKIYGPKGAALLYIKKGTHLEPLIHGGGHEFGIRSSTVNVPAIFGFFKAFELCQSLMRRDYRKCTSFSNKIIKILPQKISGVHFNVPKNIRIPNIINVRFDYIEGESLVYMLDTHHIGVSTGSACASNFLKASETLISMGLKPEQVGGSIRISLGRFTTKKELNYLLENLPQVIEQLRRVSPFTPTST